VKNAVVLRGSNMGGLPLQQRERERERENKDFNAPLYYYVTITYAVEATHCLNPYDCVMAVFLPVTT
jgi:hypothetical protein